MNTDKYRGHYRVTLADERAIARIAELSGLKKKSEIARAAIATAHTATHNSKHGRLVLRNDALGRQQGIYIGPGVASPAAAEPADPGNAAAAGALGVRHSETEVQQLNALVDFGFGQNRTEVFRRALYLLDRIAEARPEGWAFGYVLPNGDFVQILIPELGDRVTPEPRSVEPPPLVGHEGSNTATIAAGSRDQQDSARSDETSYIRVSYAPLPDTAILYGYSCLEATRFAALCARHNVKFAFERATWKELGHRFDGDATDVAGMFGNRWVVDRAAQHRAGLYFVKPYLGVFGGHYIFVRRDLVRKHLDPDRHLLVPAPGSEQSLHAVFKYQCGLSALAGVARAVTIACQEDTDWQIATRVMQKDYGQGGGTYRTVAVESLDHALEQFLVGELTGFIGGLSHASSLLTRFTEEAVVLAGPGDIECPSINSLIISTGVMNVGGPAKRAVHDLWGEAASWFNDALLNDPLLMGRYLSLLEPESPLARRADPAHLSELIRKHVRIFRSPGEAEMHEEQHQLGKKYEWLCGAYLVGGGTASAWDVPSPEALPWQPQPPVVHRGAGPC